MIIYIIILTDQKIRLFSLTFILKKYENLLLFKKINNSVSKELKLIKGNKINKTSN